MISFSGETMGQLHLRSNKIAKVINLGGNHFTAWQLFTAVIIIILGQLAHYYSF